MDKKLDSEAVETKKARSAMDPALPYAPRSLVLAERAQGDEAHAELTETLTALLHAGDKEKAHRLAQPSIPDGALRPALADFYLREAAGRRGARLLLRWLRADGGDGATQVFVPETIPALESWAHFRLLRHGRALKLAEEHVGTLTGAEAGDRSAAGRQRAQAWGQTLEAIRTSALRRGSLRLALNFHALAEALEEAHPGSGPAPKRARAAMAAVAYLLDLHTEHGLPATVTRYLARSLGHAEGDSQAAYAEMVMDLTVRPEHLDGALALAERFGFEQQVGERLAAVKAKSFQGNWKARRTVQRVAVVVLWVLVVVALLFGFTLLAHFVTA